MWSSRPVMKWLVCLTTELVARSTCRRACLTHLLPAELLVIKMKLLDHHAAEQANHKDNCQDNRSVVQVLL